MFEPFVSQKTDNLEATGLGLSIAKISVKMERSPNAIKKQLEALNLIKN